VHPPIDRQPTLRAPRRVRRPGIDLDTGRPAERPTPAHLAFLDELCARPEGEITANAFEWDDREAVKRGIAHGMIAKNGELWRRIARALNVEWMRKALPGRRYVTRSVEIPALKSHRLQLAASRARYAAMRPDRVELGRTPRLALRRELASVSIPRRSRRRESRPRPAVRRSDRSTRAGPDSDPAPSDPPPPHPDLGSAA